MLQPRLERRQGELGAHPPRAAALSRRARFPAPARRGRRGRSRRWRPGGNRSMSPARTNDIAWSRAMREPRSGPRRVKQAGRTGDCGRRCRNAREGAQRQTGRRVDVRGCRQHRRCTTTAPSTTVQTRDASAAVAAASRTKPAARSTRRRSTPPSKNSPARLGTRRREHACAESMPTSASARISAIAVCRVAGRDRRAMAALARHRRCWRGLPSTNRRRSMPVAATISTPPCTWRRRSQPLELLHALQAIEQAHGRVRTPPQRAAHSRSRPADARRFGAGRALSWRCRIPRLHERAFVLMPLAEIAPRAAPGRRRDGARRCCAGSVPQRITRLAGTLDSPPHEQRPVAL